MRPTDGTLARLPEEFSHTRSTTRTLVYSVLAVAALVALVLSLVNFEAIRDDAAEMTGRRAGLRGIIAPVVVIGCGFFALLFALLAVRGSHVWRRAATGVVLSRREFRIDCTADVAAQWHSAFASGDPANYLPIGSHKKGETWVRIYLANDDRIAFVTVQHGTGAAQRTWPLITLRDRAYVQLKRLGAADFGKPSKLGAKGTLDPFLRG